MAAGEEGGLGLGSVIGVVGLTTLVFYLFYKTKKHREELRETVNLLTDEKAGFVDDLQALFRARAT